MITKFIKAKRYFELTEEPQEVFIDIFKVTYIQEYNLDPQHKKYYWVHFDNGSFGAFTEETVRKIVGSAFDEKPI